MDRALQPERVTTSQLQVLALVAAEPDICSAEVARRSQVTAQTMKDLVRNLERAGLVERSAHPRHGRMLTLRLTPAGRMALERCSALVAHVERQMLQGLTSAERAAFVDQLVRAADALTTT